MPDDEFAEQEFPDGDEGKSAEGIVEAADEHALDSWLEIGEVVIEAASNHGRRAVRLALTQRGIQETPCGSNKNPYSRYFGYGAQQWCADFVSWAIDRTGNKDKKVPWGYPSNVGNITRWAQAKDLIMPRPDDGAIFTYKSGGHTGLVVNVSGNQFSTIEGNTSGPDGNSCWVYGHLRKNDGAYHFIRYPD